MIGFQVSTLRGLFYDERRQNIVVLNWALGETVTWDFETHSATAKIHKRSVYRSAISWTA